MLTLKEVRYLIKMLRGVSAKKRTAIMEITLGKLLQMEAELKKRPTP